MNILALDPSVIHLGWAYMEWSSTWDAETLPVIHDSGCILAPDEYKDTELVKRIGFMLEALHDLDVDVDIVIIEQPENWGAYKGMASSRSGSLLKLELLTGALVGWALTKCLEPKLIKVSQWKGQLSKNITQRRMEKKYNCKCQTNDESDAIGLGDWYLTQGIKYGV